MANEAVQQLETRQDNRSGAARHSALQAIDKQFNVGESVRTLQGLMKDVTAKDLTAETVNAACNCVNQINSTLKTTILAAKFLSDR